MKVINLLNMKGGLAKTFTVVNMAHELWRRDYKVLVLDNDNMTKAVETAIQKVFETSIPRTM